MNLRSIFGCILLCLAACRPSTPNAPASGSDLLCKQVPLTGTAGPGATLIHSATFSMLMIESCPFDSAAMVTAAKSCRDNASCGIAINVAGTTIVNEAASSTWTPVALGGGRAFTAQVGTRKWIAWDASRDLVQAVTAVSQAGSTPGMDAACCPGCTACDTGAGSPACPAGDSAPPHVDTYPAPGYLDTAGPAVCSCTEVCAAKARKELPDACECASRCNCK